MKKKYKILAAAALAAAALLGLGLLLRPQALGHINHASSQPETSVSSVSFSVEAGDSIKVSFASRLESGELHITILDAGGTVLKEWDRAKKLETFLTFDHAGLYTLKAEYTEFVGSFQVGVYKAD